MTIAIISRKVTGLAQSRANTPMGTAARPPKAIPLTSLKSKWRRVCSNTKSNRMAMRPLIVTTADRGSSNSSSTGATTNANPKLTVPITMAPAETMARAANNSRPDSKLHSKQAS